MRSLHVSILALALAPACAHAQWLNHPTAGTPRTRDGKANLAARAPRTSKGKPDLSGIWETEGAPVSELRRLIPGGVNGLGEDRPSKYFLNILSDIRPEEQLLQPDALQALQQHAATLEKASPITRCLPAGVPLQDTWPFPFKIVQTPGLVVVLSEADNGFRQIFVDGRKLPDDPQPSWLGYSVGRWEGDTLVVDTIGFNNKSWLDAAGHTHSESMRVLERFHRRDFGHLDVQITVDDPLTYTRPFTIQITESLKPDTDLIESICENEKDVPHLAAR